MRAGKFPCAIFMLALCGSVRGGYTQNFDALQPGSINGQDGWSANPTDLVQSAVSKSGQALRRGTELSVSTNRRTGIFNDAVDGQFVRLQCDVNLAGTIADFAGQPNKNMAAGLHWYGQPVAGRYRTGAIEYQGQTDSLGAAHDVFWVGGNNQWTTSPAPAKDVWYHFIADLDWGSWSMDVAILNPDGSTFFDPPPLQMGDFNATGETDGIWVISRGPNAAGLYLDNFSVTPMPEPGCAILWVAATGVALRGRRR